MWKEPPNSGLQLQLRQAQGGQKHSDPKGGAFARVQNSSIGRFALMAPEGSLKFKGDYI